MTTVPRLSPLTQALVAVAAFVVILAGMRAAANVLAPILFAFVLATLVAPLIRALRLRGLPMWLSLLTVGLLVLGAGLALIGVLYGSATQLSSRLPVYQAQLADHVDGIYLELAARGVNATELLPRSVVTVETIVQAGVGLLGALLRGLSNAVLVLLVVMFMLISAPSVSGRLQREAHGGNVLLQDFERFSAGVRSNLRGMAISNGLTGIVFALWLALFRVDFAILWGILAFLLGFIPKIGLFIAAVPAVALAFIQHGLAIALVVALGLTAINGFFDNLTTKIVGDQVNLSAVTVLLAFLVWTWVLGPLGSLLAVPLTIVLRLVLDHFDDTRWLARLMVASEAGEGSTPPPEQAQPRAA